MTMTKDEKTEQLQQTIIDACRTLQLMPNEALDVIGNATVNIIVALAPAYGKTPKQLLKIIGKSIANAKRAKN